MALLAEEVVEEWLNRQGYFTIRGIRMGVDEIDILAIKPIENGKMDCRHVEVQASINPISYISRVPKAIQKQFGISPNSAKKREKSVLKAGVKEWVDKKFNKKRKSELRKKLFDGDWSFELVINKIKYSEEIELTLDGVINRPFSTGDSFCKAILTLYAYHVPRSFSDNSLVKIDNSWLKVAFSKNYHHFFPKNYLKRNGFTEYEANSIVNITIVDDYLNKRAIGAKAPSNYMNTFKKDNDDLVKTMKTHLIDDLDDFGIWNDDYKAFLDKRGKKILRELKKRLNPKI